MSSLKLMVSKFEKLISNLGRYRCLGNTTALMKAKTHLESEGYETLMIVNTTQEARRILMELNGHDRKALGKAHRTIMDVHSLMRPETILMPERHETGERKPHAILIDPDALRAILEIACHSAANVKDDLTKAIENL